MTSSSCSTAVSMSFSRHSSTKSTMSAGTSWISYLSGSPESSQTQAFRERSTTPLNALNSNGYSHDQRSGGKHIFDLLYDTEKVGTNSVQLVDEDATGNPDSLA